MAQLTRSRQTDRLVLRRHELGDLDQLAAIYASDEVNRYLYSEPRTADETLASLKTSISHPVDVGEENRLVVAVVLRATNELIGSVIMKWADDEHRQGEVGGSLHPDHHGQGLAPEVYRELLDIGFGEYGLHRIVGRCDARNTASIRSLEKVGLREEAHLVENEFVKGEWTDEVVLAIRAERWYRQTDRAEVDH